MLLIARPVAFSELKSVLKTAFYLKHALLFTCCLLVSAQVSAVKSGNVDSTLDPGVVRVDEARFLGTPLDKNIVLLDEDGNEFTIAEQLGKPLILLFSYYTCDGVCETLNKYLAQRLTELKESEPDRDYRALTISFDKDDTVESLGHFSHHKVGVPENLKDRWKLSVMKNPEDIARLTGSLGIRYFWSSRDKVFVHPNAFIFVTPKGRVARYLHGAEFTARDLNLALVDADWENISQAGRVIDILAGVCFSYNFEEGRYTFNIPLLAGVASLLSGIFITLFAFRVKIKKKKNQE